MAAAASGSRRHPAATALIVVGAICLALVILIAAAIAALLLLDWTEEGEDLVGWALGRSVEIGDLDIDAGTVTRIHLADFTVSNAPWASGEHLATVDSLEIAVKVWPMFAGRLEFPEIVVRRPMLDLERNAEGEANWQVDLPARLASETVTPEERSDFPPIDALLIEGGRVRYVDAQRAVELDGTVATAVGEAEGSDTIELALEGTLEDEPLALDFAGGSLRALRDSEVPYPVIFNLQAGETALIAEGTALDPLQLRGFDIVLTARGPSLDEIFPILGIPLPPTRPFELSGRLEHEEDFWRFTDFTGRVGESDLSGDLTIDRRSETPELAADLVSEKLVFSDLAGFIGATPDGEEEDAAEAEGEEDDAFFPDTPVAAERLHAMNMNVRFAGEEVIAPSGLPITELFADLVLEDGRIVVEPFSLVVAGGRAEGTLTLSARTEPPRASADLTFENLDLRPFFRETGFIQEMGGRFFGRVALAGQGASLDDMLGRGRGSAWLGMREGSVSGLLVEAAGLDIVEALALLIGEDARIPVRCARIDVALDNGRAAAQRAIIDTTDSILLARGFANLRTEEIGLQVEARAKDFSLIDIAAPVVLTGTFRDPSFAIGGVDPLPFLEMGQSTNLDCDDLLSGDIDQDRLEAIREGREHQADPPG